MEVVGIRFFLDVFLIIRFELCFLERFVGGFLSRLEEIGKKVS